eukprot:TRINITY_DN4701_c0_g1_i1.p1 TRINITY_DN4701_c0_g1~~TRINITY_DN4701_c0_g1_i1.p1  ORF type:complete len:519 (+),score=116.15 TRINITY_DN4701_c0_g1_i1:216-1772(+)
MDTIDMMEYNSMSSTSPFLWASSRKTPQPISYVEPNPLPSLSPPSSPQFFKQTNNSLLYSTLLPREIMQRTPRKSFTRSAPLCDVVASRMPFTLRKSPILDFDGKDVCDKIFASCWLDSSRIAMGTKDNQLIVWNSDTGSHASITLPSSSTTPFPRDICGIHDLDTNPSSSLLVSGGKNPHDLQLFSLPSLTPTMLLQGHKNWVFASKFISEDVVVSGCRGGKVLVWNVSQAIENANKAREPSVIKDLEFLGQNSDSTEEDIVMEQAAEEEEAVDENNSDNSNNNSNIEINSDAENNENNENDGEDAISIATSTQEERKPIAVRSEHSKKVRDIQHSPWTRKFYTLSADATVKIWDCDPLTVVNTIPLTEKNELVCMAAHNQTPIIAVGSQKKVTIIDTRQQQVEGRDTVVLDSVESKDGEWGVRSVKFYGHMLSVGGGMGSLSFYDMRAQRYLGISKEGILQVGDGWSVKNDNYWNMDAYEYKHAIYTHSWDPSGTKLFVGGGPIMMGLAGGYASVW